MKHIHILLILLLVAFSVSADEVAAYRLKVQNFFRTNSCRRRCGRLPLPSRFDRVGCFFTTPDKASQIMFENNAEHLTIRSTTDEAPILGLPTIKVYSASLKGVENSGDSLLRVFEPMHVDVLKIRQIGNGSIEIADIDADYVDASVTAGKGQVMLSGKANKAKFKNVSTGPIDASKLALKQANCFIFGTGNIDCLPSEQLRIYGAGTGKVYYHTTPGKITNRGIGIKVHPATEK